MGRPVWLGRRRTRRTASAKRRDGSGALPGTPLQLRHERFPRCGSCRCPVHRARAGACLEPLRSAPGARARAAAPGSASGLYGAIRIHASQFADLSQIGRDRELDRIYARTLRLRVVLRRPKPRPRRQRATGVKDDPHRVHGRRPRRDVDVDSLLAIALMSRALWTPLQSGFRVSGRTLSC